MADASLLMLGLSGPILTPDEAAMFVTLQPAGYILFTRNIISAEQTRRLTDDLRGLSKTPPIIAIDQEGGRVTRTREIAPAAPSAPALAEVGNMRHIKEAAVLTADLLRLLGFNMNFAPVLDLDHFPEASNALRGRCWGRDPQRVINGAGQWNRWMRKCGVAGCAKHFPACGRAVSDPHHDLPSCPASWADLQREDVIPYTALMPELDAVMLAHIEFPQIDPDFPASLSPRIVRGLLRDQLGFDRHLVLTDDLDMGAIQNRYGRGDDARLAIEAGNDLAMICHRTETAGEAARAIAEVSHTIRADAAERVERFRWETLLPPQNWSADQWTKTSASLADLAEKYQSDITTVARGPVVDY
jgi:beta-N-acetylhexosaminidase